MTEESAPNEMAVPVPENMEGVKELLKQYTALSDREKAALADRDMIVDAAEALTAQIVDPVQREKEAILIALKVYIDANRKSILAKFGRTIEFTEGIIKVRVIPKSLELPKDVKPIINFLVNRRGGRKVLREVWELDKVTLAQADPRLLRLLSRRFKGFWAGRHENVTIQPVGEKKPLLVSRRRYPDRYHR